MIHSMLGIARSGLEAESRSFEAAAGNIAHMNDTIRPADASIAGQRRAQTDANAYAYRPAQVARTAEPGGGVRTQMVEADPPHERSFAPSDPMADESGMVARPSISVENEFVQMLQSRRSFEANLKSLRTADAMMGALLNAKI